VRLKTFFIFFIGLLGFWVHPVFALEGLNLVVSPLPINLITEPGSTVSAQLKIKNGGSSPETLHVGLMKFSAYGDEGKPRLMEKEKGDNYFDWITFSENDFEVNPNEWKTITATINVPKDAAFGYYYAVTFSRKNDDVTTGARETKVIGATATLVLLEVRVPNAVRDIEVLEFSTPKQIYEFLPTDFVIKLKNKGNVHVVPKGDIFIDRWNEKDVAILPINDLKGNVLPNSNRIFTTSWADGFPVYQQQIEGDRVLTDRAGKPIQKLKWDLASITKLRWGKYTASMLLAYDDGKKDIPIEGKLTFWVIPWRIIFGTIGLVVGNAVLGILIFKLVNWLRSRKKK
jgi:hypothetical protein